MKKLSLIVFAIFLGGITLIGTNLFANSPVLASPLSEACAQNPSAAGCDVLNRDDTALNQSIRNIINVLSFGVGIVSIIVIIVAGIQMNAARGDMEKIKQAQRAIKYSVAAIIIAALAFSIVNFVIAQT